VVTIAVDAISRPGRRDELHRANRTVIDEVTVVGSVIGVEDEGGAVAVQRDTDDRRS
jgi:hypothetical protein